LLIHRSLKDYVSLVLLTTIQFGNVQEALIRAEGKSIAVIPGIEVATTQGHLLCYFPTFENLNNFMANWN